MRRGLQRDVSALRVSMIILCMLHTIVLRDLISIRLIPPKVMLSVPATLRLHLTSQRQRSSHSRQKCLLLKLRLGSRRSSIEESDVCVWRVTQGCFGGREQLPCGVELGVDFNANCEFPFLVSGIFLVLFGLFVRLSGKFASFGLVFQLFAKWDSRVVCSYRLSVKSTQVDRGS